MRKVCVLTGTRAEYGLLKPVMESINKHPDLDLSLIVTGMHLSEEFGYTINEIKEDGFKIDAKVEMNRDDDTGFSMAKAVGKGIIGCANALMNIKPEIFLVLGDRIEPLAGVIAAAYMNITIAHIHGGDSAKAGIDEPARHSITKFAHIHFPATEKSAERILKMGEDEWRVFITCAPCLDTILNIQLLTQKEVSEKFNINFNTPLILLVQHAVSTEPEKADEQIKETLEAIKELKYQTIIIYPNSDSGGRRIIEQINKYGKLPFIQTYKSISHKEYLSILKYASVIVGNSSSGIIESSSFKLPVVNIGTRQEGRERAENVIDVSHDRNEIIKAIEKAVYDKDFRAMVKKCKNPYGDGKTGERIAEILSKIEINNKLLQKKLTY